MCAQGTALQRLLLSHEVEVVAALLYGHALQLQNDLRDEWSDGEGAKI